MRSRSRWNSERVGEGASGLSLPGLVTVRAAYGDSDLSRSDRREAIESATWAERVGLMAALTAIKPVSLANLIVGATSVYCITVSGFR